VAIDHCGPTLDLVLDDATLFDALRCLMVLHRRCLTLHGGLLALYGGFLAFLTLHWRFLPCGSFLTRYRGFLANGGLLALHLLLALLLLFALSVLPLLLCLSILVLLLLCRLPLLCGFTLRVGARLCGFASFGCSLLLLTLLFLALGQGL
jgi:hypothetical protein